MKDNEMAALEQYDLEINSTRKVRGAVFCETNRGPVLLKEFKGSPQRIQKLYGLGTYLEEQGYDKTDKVILNREGQGVCSLEDGTSYVLKRWFVGSECDVKREEEIVCAITNLASLHQVMRKLEGMEESESASVKREDLRETFGRHNREMKKVRSFIRGRVKKGEFEIAYLKHYQAMYDWAVQITQYLEESEYPKLLEKVEMEQTWVHGDYNYHNVLVLAEGVATTNFEHFHRDIPMVDFYYFLRKIMEKNRWNEKLGDRMIAAYDRVFPLGREELDYLAICIAYPEKFWKVANTYYRTNKAWLPVKTMEKLQDSITELERKKRFLNTIFSFHLC